jgi:peptide-methionine (S)-S-oxide reductase
VGYAGGMTRNPDYGNIGDHTEVVQIDYDPARISYTDLLDIFWNSHNPYGRQGSPQYMRAIFYRAQRQQALALRSKRAVQGPMGGQVHTRVAPERSFTLAEDYHQKYHLKSYADLAREMRRIYPSEKDFVSSTAVARLNGYAGGYGDREQLHFEIDRLGLSSGSRRFLDNLVKGRASFNASQYI